MNQRPFHRQLGAAALVVTMLLLFGSSIVVFYLNRSLVFEQKTSANQLRSTSAFEMAEAGIEWATGMLNAPYDIATNCSLLSTTNTSFRRKYIQISFPASTNVAVAATTFPGCKLVGATLTCSCPNVVGGSETVAGLGTTVAPSFTVALQDVGDTQAVRVTSTGCTAQAGACKPLTTTAATTGASDATATVSVILKLRPILRAAPSSALTCGTSCAVGGSYNIINRDVASNGYLVDAGTTITQGNGTSYETIPGQPLANALIASDATLSALANADPTCSNSTMFKAYFGSTVAEYIASPATKSIPGCNVASTCGGLVNTAYNDGWRSFYFPDGFALNNSAPFSALGSSNDGVTIVSPNGVNINGNISLYGLIFSNDANVNDLGTGTANVYGAMVTCNAYQNNGNGTLSYDPNALGGTGLRPGVMARVPGSWRDFTP